MLVVLGVTVTFFLARAPWFATFITYLSTFRYLTPILAGMLFVTTFTSTTGALMLGMLTQHLPVWHVAPLASIGALIADLTVFTFVKNDLLEEIEDILNEFHGRKLIHMFHSKAFRWTLPVLGAMIIASPLPDELGVSLLGLSKISPGKFAVLSYILNTTGILMSISVIPLLLG